MFATLEKQTAEELLYGSALPARESDYLGSEATLTKFNYGHNLSEYEKLMQNKYAGAPTIATNFYSAPAATTSFYTGARTEAPSLYAGTPATPTLESYHVAENTYVPAEPRQEYFTGEKAVPYQTFRPKIFEYEDFPAPVAETTAVADTVLEEIATVDVIEQEQAMQTEMPVSQPFVVPHLRLNAKGIIAAATFAAVVVLMTVMLVINSFAINSSAATISQLMNENAQLSGKLYDGPSSLMQQRNDAYQIGMDRAQGLQGTPNGAEQIQLPPLPPTPNLNVNSDYSTNIFDQIVKFISNIFG